MTRPQPFQPMLSSAKPATMPRFPSVLPYLVSGILARPALTAPSPRMPRCLGEVTFVGSTITSPRSGYMLGMAVQPEKVNELDAEPSSS